MNKGIIKYPNPVLRKKSEEVKEITEEIQNLGREMIQILTENQGIGLAAPQVGELKRIIVVQTENQPRVLINPKIIKMSQDKILEEEGCLSFPGLFLKIKRAKIVEIEALDAEGNTIKIKAEGRLTSRILQHEIDHLDGILFIDRLSFWQRLKLKYRNALIKP